MATQTSDDVEAVIVKRVSFSSLLYVCVLGIINRDYYTACTIGR